MKISSLEIKGFFFIKNLTFICETYILKLLTGPLIIFE
jgi:hypothetical protein